VSGLARKAVDEELSRERILNVARTLFAEYGYRSVSMRKIATELGYSHGSLYYHFKEKAELFSALVAEDFGMLLRMVQDILKEAEEDRDGIKQLEKLMFEFIRFGLNHPHHYEIMFLITDPELTQYSSEQQSECYELFCSVLNEVIKNDDPALQAERFTLPLNLFMSLHGFITYCIRFNQSFEEVEKLAKDHIALLFRGLDIKSISPS
jgi:AcrR family transcriptional regulator